MSAFRKTLEQIHPISDSEWIKFDEAIKKQEIPKNGFLLRSGSVEDYIYYIEKGILRAWIEKGEGEVTVEFSFENTIFSSYISFLTRTPSVFNIQAITDSVIQKIHYDDLQRLYTETSSGNLIGRVATEFQYIEKGKREISFLTQSASERYYALFSEQPELIQNIPLKQIASYVGVTPEALSRIRKRFS